MILGAYIILAVRNAEKGKHALEEIRSIHKYAVVTVKLLDISDISSIRNFVDQIQTECDKIDVLINNAGVIYQPYVKTVDGNELTLVTNYLGMYIISFSAISLYYLIMFHFQVLSF